ncbi:MAG: hypothetical protein CK425_06395 [Parachlamydia sp.]|nr:MAG: hypothetical protein CK425_06395 [Parachlamydia sp.]
MVDSIGAMQKYVDHGDKYVLKVTKRNNIEHLEAKSKGLITFIAKFLGFKSYKLETVCNFVKNHQASLEASPIFQPFYQKLSAKVSVHNQQHPSYKITHLFKAKSGQSQDAASIQALRQTFEAVLKDQNGMGKYMHGTQVPDVLKIYDDAMESPTPRQAFADGINARVNQANSWGQDKADHIITNFNEIYDKSPLAFKTSNQAQQTPQVIAIANIAKRDGYVAFYKTGPTEFLGNFADCPNGINVFGKSFKCSEAAFQWRKYILAGLPPAELAGFFTANGQQAFDLRNKLEAKYKSQLAIGTPAATSWSGGKANSVGGARDQAMWEVLQAKFKQNPGFMDQLQATKGAFLLEHNDSSTKEGYWSDKKDGTGLNMLGQMLTAIRDGQSMPNKGGIDPSMQHYVNQANSNLQYNIF